jgi:hypothetical protein
VKPAAQQRLGETLFQLPTQQAVQLPLVDFGRAKALAMTVAMAVAPARMARQPIEQLVLL